MRYIHTHASTPQLYRAKGSAAHLSLVKKSKFRDSIRRTAHRCQLLSTAALLVVKKITVSQKNTCQKRVGLWESISRFPPSRGLKLYSYHTAVRGRPLSSHVLSVGRFSKSSLLYESMICANTLETRMYSSSKLLPVCIIQQYILVDDIICMVWYRTLQRERVRGTSEDNLTTDISTACVGGGRSSNEEA